MMACCRSTLHSQSLHHHTSSSYHLNKFNGTITIVNPPLLNLAGNMNNKLFPLPVAMITITLLVPVAHAVGVYPFPLLLTLWVFILSPCCSRYGCLSFPLVAHATGVHSFPLFAHATGVHSCPLFAHAMDICLLPPVPHPMATHSFPLVLTLWASNSSSCPSASINHH